MASAVCPTCGWADGHRFDDLRQIVKCGRPGCTTTWSVNWEGDDATSGDLAEFRRGGRLRGRPRDR